MMKAINLITITLMIFCQSSIAQDSEAGQASSNQQEVDEKIIDEPLNDNREISNAATDEQVFIPSEEISEDAPVPFPVDI